MDSNVRTLFRDMNVEIGRHIVAGKDVNYETIRNTDIRAGRRTCEADVKRTEYCLSEVQV